jgi:hypothetical protein
VSAIVFAGPSLSGADYANGGAIEFMPPAAQGDVYRAAQTGTRVIGLIDGYFHGVPAVLHKEILWAMANGIHVLGAASMGALRAAELSAFGMRGVGRIFEAYRDGLLTDDDEVALVHGPAELGFMPASEAMVNIRATLDRAAADRIVNAATAAAIAAIAKSQFYRERTWESVLAEAEAAVFSPQTIAGLRAWLPRGMVDQKRADALALIAEVRTLLESNPDPVVVSYHFEETEIWATAPWLDSLPAGAAARLDQYILDEVRLDPLRYRELTERAARRARQSRDGE